MRTGTEEAEKDTSNITTERKDAGAQEEAVTTAGTVPYLRLHTTPTETYLAKETGDAKSPVELIKEPAAQRQTIRGKTLGSWGLERRRASRELSEMWRVALSHKDSSGFAVYVEAVISKTEETMPLFRDIPNEDAFSGIVQLVRDAIKGKNFERIQEEYMEKPIMEVLALLCQQNITMATYQQAYDILYNYGFL